MPAPYTLTFFYHFPDQEISPESLKDKAASEAEKD